LFIGDVVEPDLAQKSFRTTPEAMAAAFVRFFTGKNRTITK
jgi:hypothetical protein